MMIGVFRAQSVLRIVRAATRLGVALVLTACANAGAPPGGPPDIAPPIVLSVTPKSLTTNFKAKEIDIRFDEVISETPKGSVDLRGLVFISPRIKDAVVEWHRDRITIKPKGGWKPNTAYSVQISPGIQDLHQNTIDSSITVVFSTGNNIPQSTVTGVVFDWTAGVGARQALVEAIGKDSTIYQVLADSAGRFNLQHAAPGEYLIRAIIDRNGNRMLDPTEAFDSVRVGLVATANVELYAFPHDTVGLRISDVQVAAADSFRVVRVVYDKPMAPGQQLVRPAFFVKGADSVVVNVVLIQTAAEHAVADSIKKNRVADSTARATRDTTAAGRAKADSLARIRRLDSLAAVDRAAREARRVAAARGVRVPITRDTTPPPKMNRQTVSAELYLILETPLKPGTPYRLQSGAVRSLSGTTKSPSRQFVTPKVEKRDSTSTILKRPP